MSIARWHVKTRGRSLFRLKMIEQRKRITILRADRSLSDPFRAVITGDRVIHDRKWDFFLMRISNKKIGMGSWNDEGWMWRRIDEKLVEKKSGQVPPRFELGSLDSKSRVLTITPWDLLATFCFIETFVADRLK